MLYLQNKKMFGTIEISSLCHSRSYCVYQSCRKLDLPLLPKNEIFLKTVIVPFTSGEIKIFLNKLKIIIISKIELSHISN